MTWLNKVWLQFVGAMQEFRRDIKESSEIVELRQKCNEYYKMMCLLQDQVQILQHIGEVRNIRKNQDDILNKLADHLAALKDVKHTWKPETYERDKMLTAAAEGLAYHNKIGDMLKSGKIEFPLDEGTAYDITPPVQTEDIDKFDTCKVVFKQSDQREAPCYQCDTGEYKLTGTDPGGTQRYECNFCGDKVSFP